MMSSFELLAGGGATDAIPSGELSELTPQTLTHWIRLLLDDSEGCVQAAFLYRIVEASGGAVSAATLETVRALLASSESQICHFMLEAIEQALPMGFLGLDELHAGIAGLRWAVTSGWSRRKFMPAVGARQAA